MAKYTAELGTPGDAVEIDVSPFLGTRLFFKGQQLRRGFLSSKFDLTGASGQKYEMRLRGKFFDSLPALMVNGMEVKYAPDLPGWAVLIALGAILQMIASVVIIGGVVGMIPGALAYYYGQNIIRSNENKTTGALLAIVIVGAAWVVWAIWAFVVAAVLLSNQ